MSLSCLFVPDNSLWAWMVPASAHSPSSPPPTSSSSKTNQTFQICRARPVPAYTHVLSPLLGPPSLLVLAWRTQVQPSNSHPMSLEGAFHHPCLPQFATGPPRSRVSLEVLLPSLAVLTAAASGSLPTSPCAHCQRPAASLTPPKSPLPGHCSPCLPPPSPVTLCPFSPQD